MGEKRLVLGVDQFRIRAWGKSKREVEQDLIKVLENNQGRIFFLS